MPYLGRNIKVVLQQHNTPPHIRDAIVAIAEDNSTLRSTVREMAEQLNLMVDTIANMVQVNTIVMEKLERTNPEAVKVLSKHGG